MAPIPELLAKKKARDEAAAKAAVTAAAEAKKAAKAKRSAIFKKAEAYAKEYIAEEKEIIRLKREAKAAGGFYCEPEHKLLFVVRIKGLNKIHPKTKKILQLLRLRQINNGIFLRVSKATMGLLKYVEPYVTFGYPNLKTVRALLYKRGYGKVNGNRIPLTDNSIIEAALGKYGIVCMEDLVHEIYTVGPAFKQASNFLWPFKLIAASGGMHRKRVHYVEGGHAGNRQNYINNLVAKMGC
mmetsp:Transcript_59933/g.121679  ORF Transcript_59933/g.121679 Transcript_59933/m.121679 type:complete len:240 (-) Transcript_59933:50-769(-)